MSRLETAFARFSTALETLEIALAARSENGSENGNSSAELTLLKFQHERLMTRISALEEESHTLAGLTEEVEDRLDGAIAEIRDVLGRN